MKPQNVFCIIGTALLLGCSPADQKSNPADKTSHRAPDPAIIAKLQEIVEVRQQLLKVHQIKFEHGRAEDDGAAEIALAEARIQLARERKEPDQVIAQMRDIVTTHEKLLKIAQAKARVGAAPPEEVDRLRIALLEAQLRLQREQQEATAK